MESGRNSTPDPDANTRASDLDFVTYNEDHEICNPDGEHRATKLLERCQSILDGNGSLARHSYRDPYVLYGSTLEENIRRELNHRQPYLVVGDNAQDQPTNSLNWVDIIREAKDTDFTLQDDGTYHYQTRGLLIQLSEHEWRYILGFPKLLEPWPHPQDLKMEDVIVRHLIGELETYEQALMAAVKRKKVIVTKLNERRKMVRHYLTAQSQPSATLGSPIPRLPSKEASPVNSIIHDTRGDIAYATPTQLPLSTDQYSEQNMEIHGDQTENSLGPSMDIEPNTEQREGTRDTDMPIFNGRPPTSTPQAAGWTMDDLLNNPMAFSDCESSEPRDLESPHTPTSKRRPPLIQSEEEKKSGYKFVKDRLASKMAWDQISQEYNTAFGIDCSKQSLISLHDRKKGEHGDKRQWSPLTFVIVCISPRSEVVSSISNPPFMKNTYYWYQPAPTKWYKCVA
ncbi:uncharacterized protein N7482_000238 [Penicillium canariense]|uniref:Uncharacterized protein n=1 Tax=Penicillium canariense TaxID=189055 RepID=A0A9W9IEY9_9EURO|nr:uncharacterized protein N7482_000238 [Penicillium canariense]KAJ5174361.1 hypothetical protein N7482_000238 [Penicillium canariense]